MDRNAKVLITGGAGFLGINLARHLLSRGYRVASLDLEPFDYPERGQVEELTGDIRDKAFVDRAVEGADFVVHTAAALPLYSAEDIYTTDVEGTRNVLDAHFAADASSPVQVLVPADDVAATAEAPTSHAGIAPSSGGAPAVFPIPEPDDPTAPRVVDGRAVLLATLADPFDSQAATDTVAALRTDLDQVGSDVLVGGATALNLDVREVTDSDRRVVIPAILLVIFLVLVALLRALVAPLLLLVANVLSFGATLGISAVIFNEVFDFPPAPLEVALIGFVFLVALGIDYSIFLMTRVREESVRQGTHPGILKGLSATGGVITSAGVVLAATFAALGVIPILFMAMIGFIVAFGVLLDALVVRSLLVPALAHDVGRWIWWPSRLARESDHADAETQRMLRGPR